MMAVAFLAQVWVEQQCGTQLPFCDDHGVHRPFSKWPKPHLLVNSVLFTFQLRHCKSRLLMATKCVERLITTVFVRISNMCLDTVYVTCRQAILTQEPTFTNKAWQDISEAAKAFVKRLLNK